MKKRFLKCVGRDESLIKHWAFAFEVGKKYEYIGETTQEGVIYVKGVHRNGQRATLGVPEDQFRVVDNPCNYWKAAVAFLFVLFMAMAGESIIDTILNWIMK